MELQWPLILFTTLLAWSAGLFATQCIYALRGVGARAQIPAWITSAVLLVVGGIAVFMHLEHWERIFNGFGHITSGITQELIAIVVLAVVALIYLVYLRKNEGAAPKWIAWVGIVASAVLLVVMAHSYMMPARPAWDSIFQVISIVGAACVMGPATMAFLCSAVAKLGQVDPFENTLVVAGSAVNVITSVIYVAVMSIAGNSYASMGSYFDPTHPTYPMVDTTALSPFSDGMVATAVAVIAAIVALAGAFVGKKKSSWSVWGIVVAVCGLVSALALRILFYQMGGSVFIYF